MIPLIIGGALFYPLKDNCVFTGRELFPGMGSRCGARKGVDPALFRRYRIHKGGNNGGIRVSRGVIGRLSAWFMAGGTFACGRKNRSYL